MNWGHAGVLYSLTPGLIDGFFNILHYSLRLGDLGSAKCGLLSQQAVLPAQPAWA